MSTWSDAGSPESRDALGESLREELRPGDEGLGVARLQRALIALSYLTDEQIRSGPGIFGPKTTAAVRAFQSDWEVPASGALCPATLEALRKALSGTPMPGGWDGRRPAPGTHDARPWMPAEPPTRGDPARRSHRKYAQVIDQFAVEVNPRYAERDGNTYGHVFVWDVTRAMGVEIPHWIDEGGNPSQVGHGRELGASELAGWLEERGAARGWRKVDERTAFNLAALGHPVVAVASSSNPVPNNPVPGNPVSSNPVRAEPVEAPADPTRSPAGFKCQADWAFDKLRPNGADSPVAPVVAIVRPEPGDGGGALVAFASVQRSGRARAAEALGAGAAYWANDQGTIARTPTTDVAVGNSSPRSRELSRGDSGQDVLWIQESLVALGDLTRADMGTGPGLFGPRTESALKSFQARSGLPPTGHVGPLTRAAIYESLRYPPSPPEYVPSVRLERGSAGRHVWALQNALLKLELLDWDAFVSSPGEYGPRTETAIRSLQLQWGLVPTGIYGPATRAALKRASAGERPPERHEEEPILGAERAIAFALNPPPGEGPNGGGWHGCAAELVREAYRPTHKLKGPLSQPTALAMLDAFRAQKRVQRTHPPPRGALAFFDAGGAGYVAIALGDGRCVGAFTRGPSSDVRPCAARTFLGWAAP